MIPSITIRAYHVETPIGWCPPHSSIPRRVRGFVVIGERDIRYSATPTDTRTRVARNPRMVLRSSSFPACPSSVHPFRSACPLIRYPICPSPVQDEGCNGGEKFEIQRLHYEITTKQKGGGQKCKPVVKEQKQSKALNSTLGDPPFAFLG